jgi:HAD superfamily phosphoserine phosphatase-like hydrolase
MNEEAKTSRRKLIVFDVEGVLIPRNRYLIFEIGRKLSPFNFVKLLFLGLLYELRLAPLELTLKEVFKMLQGISIEEVFTTFTSIPLLPNVETLFIKLRKMGFKTAIISSGLPQLLVDNLASRLNIDHAFGLELELNNNIVTGNIKGEVIHKNGKALVMEKILNQENLTYRNCIVVADDRNNSSIFHPNALKIGYRPDSLIVLKSDHVITENLLDIFPIIQGTEKKHRSLTRNEAVREIIHSIGFLSVPASILLGTIQVASFLILMIILYITSEFARIQSKTKSLLSHITLSATTSPERHEFVTTPIFLALGVILSLILFPSPANYASITIVTLGDSAASIFGRLYGKTPIPFNKSKNLEGSLAGFTLAFIGATYFVSPLHALSAAIVGMLIEAIPLPVNDNLSIPLGTGVLLTLL